MKGNSPASARMNKKSNSSKDTPPPSSSSPDSPLETPFYDDKTSWSTTSSPDHIDSRTISFGNSFPSKTGAPPAQVMEPASKSMYRIPSSVFARSKSSSPMEWSMASNDSLFSIHTGGNMSFSNENYSRRMAEVSEAANVSEMGRLTEASIKGGTIRETNHDKSIVEGRCSHHSDRSNISTRSFAFPILAGGLHDSTSPVGIGKQQKQSKSESCLKQDPEHQTGIGNNVGQSSWCSCFPCRSLF